MSAATPPPFGEGSISLGLHALAGLDAAGQAAAFVEQAQTAERAGFAGVTFPEHHGGFDGYMGLPLLAATWVLGATERIWAAPAPCLVNLRNPVLLAEELAWSAAHFPNRFGAALAPGYAPSDYSLLGIPFEDRTERFEELLGVLLPTLRGEGEGAGDPCFQGWAKAPAPLVAAANSRPGVRRAARHGLGVFFPSGESRERLGMLIEHYREHGGTGTASKVRPAWIGAPPPGAIEKRLEIYKAAAAKGSRQAGGFVEPFLHGDRDHVAAELLGDLEELDLAGLNLRFHLPGVSHEEVCAQIEIFGAEVLPQLEQAFAARQASAA